MRTTAGLANSSRVMIGIAASYATDTLLLWGFALTGAIGPSVPCCYLAAGSAECLLFYYWSTRVLRRRDPANVDRVVLVRTSVSIAIQIAAVAFVPQMSGYFMALLFLVLGLASMSLSVPRAASAWGAVALITGVLLVGRPSPEWLPRSGGAQHLLVWGCAVTLLARGILLGAFARTLQLRLERRGNVLHDSMHALMRRDESLAPIHAELVYQATHDTLTGLANRTFFREQVCEAIAEGLPFAVAVLDLDRFNLVNESLGHAAGDVTLTFVARRLLSCTHPEDVVARASGDEFLVLMREAKTGAHTQRLANRCLETLCEPLSVRGSEVHLTASIGVAQFPADASDADGILTYADEAMCHAKRAGRNLVRCYDAELMGLAYEREQIERDLKGALERGGFELLYQPKIDIAGGQMRSVEGLLRWKHPVRGRLTPEAFLSVAEDIGLIHSIGAWTIGQACGQAKLWRAQGLPHLRISVNVSRAQLHHPGFVDLVHEALRRNALHPSYLEIEVSESALMANTARSAAVLEELSRLGIVVAVDDFGIGYSSMRWLQQFPIDKVKIDCSLIQQIEHNAGDASIVRAIISLAHGLRLKVVAEGVESAAQLTSLRRMGCDQYQGFHRTPAVPAAEIELMIAAERAKAANDTLIEPAISRLARLVQR
jgi:diguanylate cyclase (GGDEF)-like protein